MTDKSKCPLCFKSLSYAGVSRHIFSEEHKKDLMVGLKKRDKYLRQELKIHPQFLPYIRIKSGNLHLCYGCKKCYQTSGTFQKTHTCPQMAEGLKVVNDILDMPEFIVESPEAKTPPLPSLPPPADVEKLQKQNEQLKREKKDLIQEIDDVIERSEKSEAIFAEKEKVASGLIWVLDYLKEEECYESLMDNFKEQNQDLLKLIKNSDHW